jgi:hypothetical protein
MLSCHFQAANLHGAGCGAVAPELCERGGVLFRQVWHMTSDIQQWPMVGRECYHCKQRFVEGEEHDCWTTTETALTQDLSVDLQDAWERPRETAMSFGISPQVLALDRENPRVHNTKQSRQIARSIKELGFNVPVQAGAENKIVTGHGRVLAARKLEMPTCSHFIRQ